MGALGFGSGTSLAQYNTAEISGIVRDTQGGILPGVNVAATHVPSGLKVERVTEWRRQFGVKVLF